LYIKFWCFVLKPNWSLITSAILDAQSAAQRMMLIVMLEKLSASLPMLAADWV
jgi:hypothetical protein